MKTQTGGKVREMRGVRAALEIVEFRTTRLGLSFPQ
jgi:predicted NUDIX family NTP pyrophosphohydrolase